MTMEPDLLLAMTTTTLAEAAEGPGATEAEPAAVAREGAVVGLLLLLEEEVAVGAEGMQGAETMEGDLLLLGRRERHPLLALSATMATEQVSLSSRSSSSTFADTLYLLLPAEDKLCKCGEPAVQRTVRKDGPNKDRQFSACPKPQGEGCGFFDWADGNGNGSGSNAQQGNGGYGGGGPAPAPRFQGQKRPAPGEEGASSGVAECLAT